VEQLFDTVNGLPTHVLVVHIVVVFLPLSALGALAIAAVSRWSARFGPLVWAGALISTGASFVAEESGEKLAARVGMPVVHAQLGEQVKYFAFALFVLTFILWVYDRGHDYRSLLVKILAVVVAIAAVAAIWSAVRAGDSGVESVWRSVIQNTPTPPQ
jgi:hypothetical protein